MQIFDLRLWYGGVKNAPPIFRKTEKGVYVGAFPLKYAPYFKYI